MFENVVKRSEFGYTREQRYTKVIYYYYLLLYLTIPISEEKQQQQQQRKSYILFVTSVEY